MERAMLSAHDHSSVGKHRRGDEARTDRPVNGDLFLARKNADRAYAIHSECVRLEHDAAETAAWALNDWLQLLDDAEKGE
jgi:hypothetical protein